MARLPRLYLTAALAAGLAGCWPEGDTDAELTQPSTSSLADPADVEGPTDPGEVPGTTPSTPPPGDGQARDSEVQ